MNKIIGLIFFLMFSCYGVFRTAKPVKNWAVDLNCMLLQDIDEKYKYYDSPSLIIRKNIGERKDIGLKIFYGGFEVLFFEQIINENEERHLPSAGVQLGVGTPLYQLDFIISKEIYFISPYLSLRVLGFHFAFV